MSEHSDTNISGATVAITFDDFRAHMPDHRYIFMPTRELWPASSVDSRLVWPTEPNGAPVLNENGKPVSPSKYLDKKSPVEQMTWAPGEPMLIEHRLIDGGGWIKRSGCTVFNLYRPPTTERGDPDGAEKWLDHVRCLYPTDAEHIVRWLAQRVQAPGVKINHALVLGGRQGIGKDTILEPVKQAVGPWNFHEVSPAALLGRFNGFVKSVILRISEARDLGDIDRFTFYDHTKVYTAAPPDVIRCDEKNLREHSVPNVCGTVITTNHKSDGIYLPADDRRHYVAWSDLDRSDFTEDYWRALWSWYANGGIANVAAYLAALDLDDFNPKAPPLKTAAFWHIVNAARSPEESELADVLDGLGNPDVTTIEVLADKAPLGFAEWLRARPNRRQVPHRLETVGYEPVRNELATDGLWKIGERRQVVYARTALTPRERYEAVKTYVEHRRRRQ
jgi:hypothetical protein